MSIAMAYFGQSIVLNKQSNPCTPLTIYITLKAVGKPTMRFPDALKSQRMTIILTIQPQISSFHPA